ncbi:myo-inositol-1(Or 4)-monophosphatase [Candidatus Endolissoclinum faulkneri L5]|uniref:Inositol-1-monophosphatase n=1 Tax=Candidatus Endolissoclinum faulkneri L5 TaxID=1401328 RepID=V9TUD1_9PROT|nr:inositol monophosphatase family protein [Candidatus Endolissoclinum faulkneri]AHC73757.1 myo-inositol-1(Or 4)-monophosphatase [Candidatus Endolissoclinum faulkneri L5]
MAVHSALYNVIFKACQKAARNLRRDFGEIENLQVSKKTPIDFVLTADRQTERSLYEELKQARPKYGFLMKAKGTLQSTDPNKQRWIIDSLDGAKNFLHGIPHFAISVALEEKGEIIAGAIYQPLNDEFYWAEKGSGAYLNNRRLRVSSRSNIRQALLATNIPTSAISNNKNLFSISQAKLRETSAGVRCFGSSALNLAWVASGRLDGYWEKKLTIRNTAAGILLVKEAGGYISDFKGRVALLKSGDLIAANSTLHTTLVNSLSDINIF